jgi:hypothetical protein
MKKITSLVIVVSLLFPSGVLFAQKRQGVQLEITKTDGTEIKGELIAVKENLLLLMDSLSGGDVSTDIREVRKIVIINESRFKNGLLYGLLWGGSVGAIIGFASYGKGDWFSRTDQTVIASLVFGGAGVVIGGLAGLSSGINETIKIEGSPPEKLALIREKLRKKARFPDYQ